MYIIIDLNTRVATVCHDHTDMILKARRIHEAGIYFSVYSVARKMQIIEQAGKFITAQ